MLPTRELSTMKQRSLAPTSQLKIVVLGYIVRGPIGGMAWHHLQYVLGLHRLGHRVLFVEESDDYPSCYDPTTHKVGTDPSYGLSFANDAFKRLGMADYWAYHDDQAGRWHGPATDTVKQFCGDAELLLNISGVNPIGIVVQNIPVKVLID